MITDSKVIVDDFLQPVISLILSWVQIDLASPPPSSSLNLHVVVGGGRMRDTSLMDN